MPGVLVIWVVCCIWDHMYCSHIFRMLTHSMPNGWYTPFGCMYLYCVSWWCCLGTGHLNGSWFLAAQGYMLDWLGGVTSTVSFCQLSGGVCYPMNLCIYCRLRMDLCQTYGVCNYAFCIVFEWYFVLVFVFCFMYEFYQIFTSMGSVYWFHSKPPCIFACLVLCLLLCQFWSLSE